MKKISYGYLRALENALFTAPFCACGKVTHLLVKEKLRFYKSAKKAKAPAAPKNQ